MKLELKDCLIMGLESKGFSLDFEAKADIDGGFECYMFSNGKYVAIMTGENSRSKRGDGKAKMAYKNYYCRLGDDDYLKKFLESEGIIRNPGLLTGEYGGLFTTIINKVMDYGTEDAASFVSPLEDYDSTGDGGVEDQCPKYKSGYALHS